MRINKFKISAPICFEYILKKHGGKTVNPLIKICINTIENRITFKTKTG